MSKFVILANRCFAESRLIDTKLTYFYKINKRLKSSVGNIAVEKSYKFDIQIIDIFCTAKKYSSFSRHFPCVPRSSDRVSPSCGTLRRAVAAGAGAGPAPSLIHFGSGRTNLPIRDGRGDRPTPEDRLQAGGPSLPRRNLPADRPPTVLPQIGNPVSTHGSILCADRKPPS